jgi:hypothetical protein
MTSAEEYAPLLLALPEDIPSLVKVVQGLMVHIFWAERYGLKLDETRQSEVQIRPALKKLERILALDPLPLDEPRPFERRLVGNCRDHSVLLLALLHARNIAARARCGFGTYFGSGHYEDHWMVEYWQPDAGSKTDGRWVQVDAQLDALQREVLPITFDPLDMPAGAFITGGLAWQMCRCGEADPDTFGIFDMKGWDFVKNDLLLDFRALNKVELLPWDVCGLAAVPYAELSQAQLALLDRVAQIILAGNGSFEALRSTYRKMKRCKRQTSGWGGPDLVSAGEEMDYA